jgi:hypothetical protein
MPTVGFIAQEVEAVFPLAAKTTCDFVPIEAKSTGVVGDFVSSVGFITVNHIGKMLTCTETLDIGTMLRFSTSNHTHTHVLTVLSVQATTDTPTLKSYTIACESVTESCSITIKDVMTTDFKSLDYNALVACTISTVQGLLKRVAILEKRLTI